jgi:GT2 family glycosyltransferase
MPSALESNQRSCRNGVGFQGTSNSVDERVSITADVVSAVVVTYGDRAHLCVQVIERLADIGVLEILLVDNGSSAAAISVYQKLTDQISQLRILSLDQNLGSAVGFTAGIEYFLSESDGTFIWILDDDNLPSENVLSDLSRVANELIESGVASDPVLHCNRSDTREADATALKTGQPKTLKADEFMGFSIANWIDSNFGGSGRQLIDSTRAYVEIHRGSYGGLLASRKNISRIGLPQRDFVLYADDTEYTYRFHQNGIRQFLIASATVTDLEPTFAAGSDYFSSAMSDMKVYFSIRNHVYLSQDRRVRSVAYWLNKSWLLCLLSLRALIVLLVRPRFLMRRYALIFHAIRHGESKNLFVSSLEHFERWNLKRGYD